MGCQEFHPHTQQRKDGGSSRMPCTAARGKGQGHQLDGQRFSFFLRVNEIRRRYPGATALTHLQGAGQISLHLEASFPPELHCCGSVQPGTSTLGQGCLQTLCSSQRGHTEDRGLLLLETGP